MSLFPYANPLINPFPRQFHPTEFDGTVGRGRFALPGASRVVGIYGKSDVDVDWEIAVIKPSLPGESLTETERTFVLARVSSSDFIANNDNWKLPAGSVVLLKSTAGTNIRGQLDFMLMKETF